MPQTDWLQSNLKFVDAMDASLGQAVREAPSVSDQVTETRSGHLTLKLQAEDGREKYLHSRMDPVRSAVKLAEAETYEGLQVFILLGLGLGYELDEVLQRMNSGSALLIIEPSMSVFRTWLELSDRSEALQHQNALFCIGWTAEEFYPKLRSHMGRMFAGSIRFVQVREAAQIYPDYFKVIRTALLEFIKVGAFMLKTSFSLARANLDNRMQNLPFYACTPGVEWYKDKFKGKPGICVLAGPSLAKNIDLLREVKGKVPLISVSTTLKLMLNRGIVPDFTAVLDFQKISRNFFSDIDPDLKIPLLCDPKGNWDSIANYTGPRVFYQDDFIEGVFEDKKQVHKDWIQSGGTVAHLAFSFARYMGCDPIILIGQDLAYSDGLTHIPGTVYFSWWKAETNRFNHYEAIEWRYVLREIERLKPLEDWQGNTIYTTDHFTSYARELEVMITETKQDVVDATEGGVVLKGADLMTLREAIDTFVQEPLDENLFAAPLLPVEQQRERLQYCQAQLNTRIDEAKIVVREIETALATLTTIRNRFRRDKNVEHLVSDVQDYNKVLDGFPQLMATVSSLMVSDEFFKQIEDAKIEAENLKGKDRFEAQLSRDRNYMDALRHATRAFVRSARTSLECVERLLGDLP